MKVDGFTLSSALVDPAALEAKLTSPAAGAVVTFTGRVRNHSQGRAVVRLEYEGAEALAQHLFGELAGEIRSRYEVEEIGCTHRTGTLEIGDVAVWIGISAAHRGPAFDACRYLIDELKTRLPIWKKEYYADGNSGWIQGG